MQVISYGYKIPKLDDKDFWESYNFDVTRLSTHDHDGQTSAPLRAGVINPYAVLVETADWIARTLPATGYQFNIPFDITWDMEWDDGDPCPVQVVFRTTDNNIAFPEYNRISDGSGIQVYVPFQLDLQVGMY